MTSNDRKLPEAIPQDVISGLDDPDPHATPKYDAFAPPSSVPLPPNHSNASPTLVPEVLERLIGTRTSSLKSEGIPFGRFTLFGRLGKGGMAEVRLATVHDLRHTITQLAVVKRILPHKGVADPYRALFAEEAKISALLRHPHIAPLLESGEVDGAPYIAFELVDGLDLKDLQLLIEPARIPLRAIVDIGQQAASALDYAHHLRSPDGRLLNVVHRDVTPHNLLINRDGQLKLVDFGIAQFRGRDYRTKDNQVRGKLGYFAPEQLRNEPYDGRVDVFSLGVTLCELLAGEPILPPLMMVALDLEFLIRKACQQTPDPVPEDFVQLLIEMTQEHASDRLWPARKVAERLSAMAPDIPGPSLQTYALTQIYAQFTPLNLSELLEHAPTQENQKQSSPLDNDTAPTKSVLPLKPDAAQTALSAFAAAETLGHHAPSASVPRPRKIWWIITSSAVVLIVVSVVWWWLG